MSAADSAQRLLICGAFAPEIDHLTEQLQKPGASALPAGGTAECAALGIGSVAAAIALQARLLDRDRPRITEVLFVGSAGVYAADQPAGQGASGSRSFFGRSESFCKRDLAVLENRASVPGPLEGEVLRGGAARGQILGRMISHADLAVMPDGLTNSTDSITLVTPVDRSGMDFPDYENLEGYGVARVCWQYDLPYAAVFALTNHVGPEGSAQWRANFRSMSIELQALIASALFAN